MQEILVLNGPNLGMLGAREPEVYGHATLDDLRELLEARKTAEQRIEVRQTGDEAELIGWIHEAFHRGCDVILNPAAFTHYSYGLRDAAAMLQGTSRLIEVHISNPHTREAFRHMSTISGVATGVIAGFGFQSYVLALSALTD
ncbi:3-dehydroquinate dehydratase [Leucobacter sp. UCMA 4100]|uniref:type II 3-dehydroquinate dehydratase n=1 Tax=Leucobacter sp. UCMA 4100 TaxID=2810534 RepID=UPI0022EAC0A9|nr:type II 3-dehydroquinate dehydratase [Leucobacter sp. UCMA 4100]MDA3145895.1 3-dehydroquinate dehydratase [Leucobacter sp. UCMA 4100]